MKNLILFAALAFMLVGCAHKPVTVIPAGSAVVFKTDGDAAGFRASTLIDPTHIGRVVRLNAPLKVMP